jgi:glucosamine 6-phosphate synthetase-like amidotransferase/phosphosugar isomerase protein
MPLHIIQLLISDTDVDSKLIWSSNTVVYEFSVCTGIVTNYKEVKLFLQKKGYHFESDTDTEIIAKLVHHLYQQNPSCSFRELVEQVIQQLVRI